MTWRSRAAAVLREPLAHFLIAGALVYALLAGRAPDVGERRIVVNEEVVSRIADRFALTFRRAPTAEELDGLISDYVHDQVYYREALRLGLDKDDEVVMRRMRNKMVSIATSDAEAAEPDDAELQKLLDKDPGRYAREPQITFSQLYFGADSPAARTAANEALALTTKGADASRLTQPAPIQDHYAKSPGSDVAAIFGDEFAGAVARQPRGKWVVMTSGLGLHLVRLEALDAPAPPSVAEARQQLANDWRNAATRKAEDEAYRKIVSGYDVVIELPGK